MPQYIQYSSYSPHVHDCYQSRPPDYCCASWSPFSLGPVLCFWSLLTHSPHHWRALVLLTNHGKTDWQCHGNMGPFSTCGQRHSLHYPQQSHWAVSKETNYCCDAQVFLSSEIGVVVIGFELRRKQHSGYEENIMWYIRVVFFNPLPRNWFSLSQAQCVPQTHVGVLTSTSMRQST